MYNKFCLIILNILNLFRVWIHKHVYNDKQNIKQFETLDANLNFYSNITGFNNTDQK